MDAYIFLYQIPVRGKGINDIWDCNVMDNREFHLDSNAKRIFSTLERGFK